MCKISIGLRLKNIQLYHIHWECTMCTVYMYQTRRKKIPTCWFMLSPHQGAYLSGAPQLSSPHLFSSRQMLTHSSSLSDTDSWLQLACTTWDGWICTTDVLHCEYVSCDILFCFVLYNYCVSLVHIVFLSSMPSTYMHEVTGQEMLPHSVLLTKQCLY